MHISRIFLYTLLSFTAGVAVQSFVAVPAFLMYAGGFAGGFLCIMRILAHDRVFGIFGIFCIAFAGGVLRYQQKDAEIQFASVQAFHNMPAAVVTGVIADDSGVREKNTRYVVSVESVEVQGDAVPAAGGMIVFANRYPAYQFGDAVSFTGTVVPPEPFDGFDYPSFLAKDGIYSQMFYPDTARIASGKAGRLRTALFAIKGTFNNAVQRVLPEPHAAFLSGLVVGTRSSIPPDVLDAFRVTGVSHIIALSGFNITIIAESMRRMLRALTVGPAGSFWISAGFIVLFALMTGASPSIVRAALLGILVLLAHKEGRMYAATNALVFAGALMVFQNPKILRFDIAFQLSFLATAGLLYAAPRLERCVEKLPRGGGIRGNFVTTLSAQLLVVPLLLFQFGTVSLISPLTNILILSVIPVTMFAGFAMWITGFISTVLSIVPAGLAYILLSYQLFVTDVFSRIPYADVYIGSISWPLAAVFYGTIFYFLFKTPKKRADAEMKHL